MENDDRPGDTLLIGLTSSSQMAGEIQSAIRIVHERENIDVMMDFSRIGTLNLSDVADLLRLRNLLRANHRRLVLSNVGLLTKAALSVSGLGAMFEIAPDGLNALASPRSRPHDEFRRSPSRDNAVGPSLGKVMAPRGTTRDERSGPR